MNRISLLPAVLTAILALVGAQPGGTSSNNNDQYPHARLSPSMATIIVVLIAVVFFMVFFSIYIRHCSDSSSHGPIGSIRRALSRRAAARGLDPSVLETFPILTYSEVRDHKIGKDALECAVCLNEFEPDETLRLIPRCDHVFHPDCIDAWLESHVTCPVCRANLIPDPAASANLPASMPPLPPPTDDCPEIVAVQVDDVSTQPGRSASLTRAKTAIVLGRFRSHSTGHSVGGMGVVRPGENLERFTLRLPEQVRKEVMDRSKLNRTGSCAAPGLQSQRGRSYKRVGQDSRSDRWLFFSRGLSIKSPKVMAEAGEDSGCGGRTPVKISSFKCLEPKADDETGLFSPEHDARSPV